MPGSPETLSPGDRRRVYGQNFFARRGDARAFADQLDVPDGVRVVEIGPGSGMITEALADRGLPVTAVEIDDVWGRKLSEKGLPGVEVLVRDFRDWTLDDDAPVAFVGNLPFGDGTDLLRRTLDLGPDAMTGACFLLQAEYVRKRAGAYGGNLFNAQWGPWYDLREGLSFRKDAFRPVPRTDTATLLVRPRAEPYVPWAAVADYQDLVTTTFGTGRFTVGESAKVVGHGLPGALRRAGVEPDTPMKRATTGQWAALYAAATA